MSKNRNISIVGVTRIEKPQNLRFWPHAHACRHIDIRHNFIISKTVSAVRADATEVPTSRHKSSSTNGLAATRPQSGSNFKKFLRNQFFRLHYDQKNTLNPLVKSVFKSVQNHGRYLHFCARHVCSIQYAATRRLQLRAWPILCTGLRPAQLFLVEYLN